jgi:hypothetical protein
MADRESRLPTALHLGIEFMTLWISLEDQAKFLKVLNVSTVFTAFAKNAACYLAELGLSDIEIGSVCGISPETVRHYTKRARFLMIARGVWEKITLGDEINTGRKKPCNCNMVTPTAT